MPPTQTQPYEIRPSAPDDIVRGLLALPLAQSQPLDAGSLLSGYTKSGSCTLAAAIQGNLTVASHQQYTLLEAGQAFLLWEEGPYTIQAVSDCLCMTVSLQGEDGVLLTVQALEPFSTTLHLTYTKEAGTVSVALGDTQRASLEAGTAQDASADVPVSLAEGRNDICLSGEDGQLTDTAVLDIPDFSLVESFGTGTIR